MGCNMSQVIMQDKNSTDEITLSSIINRSITSISIPYGITTIGTTAFAGCTLLASISIPYGITTIDTGAFADCTLLASVTVQSVTPPSLGSGVFSGTSQNLVIYVPAESVDTYKAASGWSSYASRIQAIPS